MVGEAVVNRGVSEMYEAMGLSTVDEVPMLEKRIDIVVPDGDELIAIESKVKNWRKAFRQAISYRLCADRVYIAMWHEFAHRVDEDLLTSHGIGLIVVGDETRVAIDSERMWEVHSSVRRRVLEHLGERGPSPGVQDR